MYDFDQSYMDFIWILIIKNEGVTGSAFNWKFKDEVNKYRIV